MGEKVANGEAILSVVVELPGAFQNVAVVVKYGWVYFEFWLLAIFLGQLGLRVETVDLGDATVHIKENNATRLGCKVRSFRI